MEDLNPLATHTGSVLTNGESCPSMVMWTNDNGDLFVAIRNPAMTLSDHKTAQNAWMAAQISGSSPTGFSFVSTEAARIGLDLDFIHYILTQSGWRLITPDDPLQFRLMDPRPFLQP